MLLASDRLEFLPPPTRGLLRALGLALLAHAFLLAALTWGVHWKSQALNVSVEAELWSAVPQTAAPPLVELPPAALPLPPVDTAPEPLAAVPAQPPMPDANIALAHEKLRIEKKELEKRNREKLKQEKLLLEQKHLQDKREQDRKAVEEKRKKALQAQQESRKLEAQRQANIERATGLAGAAGAPNSTGTAQQSSGPSASYAGRIRARIKPNIVFVDNIAGNPMAEVEVRTAPDGTIISRKLTQASGVNSWDDAVLKAIDKTEKLPRDVDGRVPGALIISFKPKD